MLRRNKTTRENALRETKKLAGNRSVYVCLLLHVCHDTSYDVVKRESSEYNQSLCFPLIVLQHSYHDAINRFSSKRKWAHFRLKKIAKKCY